ncbi:MAG TPA: TolC family protein, partial [Gemmata sp.]|nr:TolC family protein [Gemmata sp.]
MTSAKTSRTAARWLAGAGVLFLPACAAYDTGPPVAPLPPPTQLTALPAPPAAVVPAAAQVKADEKPKPAEPAKPAAALPAVPPAAEQGKPLPIDLPTALTLTNANPLDIRIAGERVQAATAALERAKVLWLPNIGVGLEYYRHDGQIQDIAGKVFTTSRSSFLVGGGPTAVFPVSDALYAPLAARQVVRARQADLQAVRNDTTLSVAEAYFTVQQ